MGKRNRLKQVMSSLEWCHRYDGKAFDRPGLIQSRSQASSLYSTHYGLMIPNLGDGLQFLDIVLVLGQPGILCMDEPARWVDKPMRTLSLLAANPAMSEHLHDFYSIPEECDIDVNGTDVRVNNKLVFKGEYPHYYVHLTHDNFEVELEIQNTDKVSWFSRVPVMYSHIGLLSHFKGHVSINGVRKDVSGDLSFEYAAGISPHALPASLAKLVAGRMRFFTYQVITLSTGHQLLVTLVKTRGADIKRAAWLKSKDDYGAVFEHVNLEVLTSEQKTSPDNKTMLVPTQWKWLISKGNQDIVINATLTTPYYYGLGRGYAGGFELEGRLNGKDITGTGYIEYIDCLQGWD